MNQTDDNQGGNAADLTGRDWLTPNVEDLIVEGQLPEMVLTVLIGIDMDTGQRAVNWNLVGGEHGGDCTVALGAIEVVKQRLLNQLGAR